MAGNPTGGGMLNLDNQFWQFVRTAGCRATRCCSPAARSPTLFNLIVGLRDRRALAAGLLGILPLYYMARGGVVLDFYIIAAIPFLCLNLAVALSLALNRLPIYVAAAGVGIGCVALVVGYWQAGTSSHCIWRGPATPTGQSVAWIKEHVPADSRIVTVDDQWTDLHDDGYEGPAFPNVHSHWKVGADPAIEGGVFNNDWHTVDYVIMLPGIQDILESTDNYVTLGALQHAHLVKRWEVDGDAMELWKVDKPGATDQLLLADSNAYLEAHFDHGGAFPERDGTVTSEAQAYALLRAAWSNDRTTFDRTWAWTSANLLNDDGLLAWAWRDGAVADQHSASDADTDAALALLMAGRQWNDADLQDAGTRMVRAIWAHDVTTIQGAPYVDRRRLGDRRRARRLEPELLLAGRLSHLPGGRSGDDWLGVVDSGYTTLFNASADPLGSVRSDGLPPDWLGLDHATGQLQPLLTRAGDTTGYGYDAARTFWRIALDARWTGDGRAEAYLQQAGFLRDEAARQGAVSASYSRDGQALQDSPSPVGTAGAIAALSTLDPSSASALYAGQIVGAASIADGAAHWGDPSDLYGQEWSWFGTAMYANLLPDLWHGSRP